MAKPGKGQLSLLEQGREAWPCLSDVEVIRSLASRLLAEAEARPPVDVELLASLRGIVRIDKFDQPFAGMLLPERDSLIVRVRSDDSPERQRFTVLHEAGHTLLPGFSEKTQFRCPGRKTTSEELSDFAATELLFPRSHFATDLASAPSGMDGIEELAALYNASIEATALRAVELAQQDVLLVVLTLANKPADSADDPAKLRVRYSRRQGRWPYVRRFKSVSEDAAFQRALDGEIVDELTTVGDISSVELGPVRVSARRYGWDGRVLALVSRP